MMLQDGIAHPADPHQAEKITVLDLPGVKFIRHQQLVPVVGVVAVFDQHLQVLRAKLTPRRGRMGDLAVAEVIFVLTGREILGGDKVLANAAGRHDSDIFHLVPPESCSKNHLKRQDFSMK